jgi:hypothetical protein
MCHKISEERLVKVITVIHRILVLEVKTEYEDNLLSRSVA